MTYFYPRPPRGGRHNQSDHTYTVAKFLSTPSARRATGRRKDPPASRQISIHALREEGDHCQHQVHRYHAISIHALREEGDIFMIYTPLQDFISIHALREEGDVNVILQFGHLIHFYPRPPRGGRPLRALIRAGVLKFLSTPSARRATPSRTSVRRWLWISIHALREEGDGVPVGARRLRCDFYPRPPRGGRLLLLMVLTSFMVFLSTPSARRATGQLTQPVVNQDDFYPRPPRGGRPVWYSCHWSRFTISIHALREEGDECITVPFQTADAISIHALREEGD